MNSRMMKLCVLLAIALLSVVPQSRFLQFSGQAGATSFARTASAVNDASSAPAGPGIGSPSQARVNEAYGKLPLSFEANKGQTDPHVKFLSRGNSYSLFLTDSGAVLALAKKQKPASGKTVRAKSVKQMLAEESSGASRKSTSAVLRMKLLGAQSSPKVTGQEKLPGKVNYFIGSDPAKWRTDVATYAKVRYHQVYPGIDLVYYGNQGQLEYDFVVAPGGDPARVRLGFEGARKMRVDRQGDLLLETTSGPVRWQKPVVYQETEGVRTRIEGNYLLRSGHQASFEVGDYDPTKPLIIDPTLVYSTYLGGIRGNGSGIAVDSLGNAYVTGSTSSSSFPTTVGAFQTANAGGNDAFVTKLNADGTGLDYSTYLGGSDNDQASKIAVDSLGNAYVTGNTSSTDFPTTAGALQTANAGGSAFGGDAFVTKLNASGTGLLYSTYLGGSGDELGSGIAVDSLGNAYVTGNTSSTDFPTTAGALQTANAGGSAFGGDAFVTKLNADGTGLEYSTYLGGSDNDFGRSIAVDSLGSAYVTGSTSSTNFPTTVGAFQTANAGVGDAFVTKLNAAGTGIDYSTYLGGSKDDFASSIAVDSLGNAYVTGQTRSSNFPTTVGAFQPVGFTFPINVPFVTKLNASGTGLLYSTYLGGGNGSTGSGIAVDSLGSAYVTGSTLAGFPRTVGAFVQPTSSPGIDAFVTKLNAAGTGLLYSAKFGGSTVTSLVVGDAGNGIAVDSLGNAYVTGSTISTNFPTTVGAFQTANPGGLSAFVAKFALRDNTPTGSNIGVQPVDSTGPVIMNFSEVSQAGTTNLTTSNTGPTPPVGFQLGDPATYYDLTTTAVYSGSITLCINYTGINFTDESSLRLFHFEGGQWVDVTTSLDTGGHRICGSVTSLSPFAIFEPGSAGVPRPFYLHGTGSSSNPATLFLNNTAPTAATAKSKDSASVNFSGGNPWKEVGTWPAAPALSAGTLTDLSDLHVWLGLKNSDDQGTRFDLRVEVYKNGTLVAAGETLCIEGVTRNPSMAKDVTVMFAPFSSVAFNGTTDAMSMKVLTRIGTNGAGGFCGGHSNAVGLRLYFDAGSQPARFTATL